MSGVKCFRHKHYKREKGQTLTPWGVLPEKFVRGVRPASQNPYPIYDQNLQFSLLYLWLDTLFMTWLLDH